MESAINLNLRGLKTFSWVYELFYFLSWGSFLKDQSYFLD